VQNLAREVGIARSTVETYFTILEDTLLGYRLPAFRPGVKVREQTHSKFYWFDPGVARAAAGYTFEPKDLTVLPISDFIERLYRGDIF